MHHRCVVVAAIASLSCVVTAIETSFQCQFEYEAPILHRDGQMAVGPRVRWNTQSIVSGFGMEQGAQLELQVTEFQATTWRAYSVLKLREVHIRSDYVLCHYPASMRFAVPPPGQEGALPWTLKFDVPQASLYTLQAQVCGAASVNITGSVNMVNVGYDGELSEHLGVQELGLRPLYKVLLAAYLVGLVLLVLGCYVWRRNVPKIYYAYQAAVQMKAISIALKLGCYHGRSTHGEVSWFLDAAQDMGESVTSATLLVVAVNKALCRPTDAQKCRAYLLSEYALQSMLMLGVIVALNYTIAQLKLEVDYERWNSFVTPLAYMKLDQFQRFRFVFLGYLLMPTFLLILNMEIFADGELEAELKRLGGTGDASVKQLLGKGYRDVVQLIIRPQRALYNVEDLGPVRFRVSELSVDSTADNVTEARRRDFVMLNDRGLKVCCSHWQLFSEDGHKPAVTPCLIYLHSNIGSRMDALRVRDAALRRGFSVFTFDCCGSGLSDGVYVTMGWNEAMDLFAVLQTLEHDESVSDICLYAHSMGTFPVVVNMALRAAGAADKKMLKKLEALPHSLRTGQAPKLVKPIRGIVLDSGYASMTHVNEGLLRQMQDEGFPVPKAMMKLAMATINKSVKKRTEVDIELLRPVDYVGLCYAPALFVAAENDRYVPSEQSDELASKYAGLSKVKRVIGAHYDPRDPTTYEEAVEFLHAAIYPTGSKLP
ncbi:hypothetical protein BBO99_00004204 [Phytophthora kernoviae]|uniref:Serine aminopeptidase S33 domain-containing protein n=1 Tax=Phytophthora kernoviae TaxID=325452 RepID=A0A3R7K077_9STRA|nr:hypothetical protein JM16_004040 [Phytophthora kernoviae]RLM97652.1 hypothetical protein BBI17_004050 [Phytophthora kernoviae]RLN80859.1 hypothetical protein BBO99_00004204 [Phytophthora kernoviae]